MFARILLVALTVSIGAALGACSTRDHNSDGSPKATNYPADGYMGITSVSPNDPTNPTHHHYRDDVALMKAVIGQIRGISDSAILLHGPYAHIKLELEKGLSHADAQRIQSEAYEALSANMPRYVIRVSVSRH
jgi:hypothetical protein